MWIYNNNETWVKKDRTGDDHITQMLVNTGTHVQPYLILYVGRLMSIGN